MRLFTGKRHFLMFVILIILVVMNTTVRSQYESEEGQSGETFPWPDGASAAVSLTFDDARDSQLDEGIPLLNKYGVKATFYVVPGNMEDRAGEWRAAAENGHELGNHSLNHPCTGNFAFAREKALENYTLTQMAGEMENANREITRLTGITPSTFAYPCGQTFVGRGVETKTYVPLVAERFLAGRLWLSEDANDPAFCDLAQVLGMESDGKSFDEMKALIEQAKQEGSWLVFAGHDIGSPARQTTLTDALEAFCRYVVDPENNIWVAPVKEVAGYIKKHRSEP